MADPDRRRPWTGVGARLSTASASKETSSAAQHGDACVDPRRIDARAGEAAVKGDDQTTVGRRRGHDVAVARTGQPLAVDRVDVVAQLNGYRRRGDGEVFVELDPPRGAGSSGCSSSRARTAA
jgi:hypothetical protein